MNGTEKAVAIAAFEFRGDTYFLGAFVTFVVFEVASRRAVIHFLEGSKISIQLLFY